MIPNLWRLRYDPAPLTDAVTAWTGIADKAERTADHVLAAARRVVGDSWESRAAEQFDQQHRVVVAGLDAMARVAREIALTLSGIDAEISTTQRRLDAEWAHVDSVPHEYVGAEQILLFWPDGDSDRQRVMVAMDTARTIRADLDDKLHRDAGALDSARSTFVQAGAPLGVDDVPVWDPSGMLPGRAGRDDEVTTVEGAAQSPAALVPGVGAVAFSAPSVDTSLGGAMAGGMLGRAALAGAVARSSREQTGVPGPMAGGMPVRAGGAGGGGTGTAGRRSTGPQVLRAPTRSEPAGTQEKERARQEKVRTKVGLRVVDGPALTDSPAPEQPVRLRVETQGGEVVAVPAGPTGAELEAAREEAARRAEEEAAREAKRDEVAERRAARAARRAARQAEAADA